MGDEGEHRAARSARAASSAVQRVTPFLSGRENASTPCVVTEARETTGRAARYRQPEEVSSSEAPKSKANPGGAPPSKREHLRDDAAPYHPLSFANLEPHPDVDAPAKLVG